MSIFTEFVVDNVASNTSLVILGDFNIHVNDANDPNASIFVDMMTALGMKQHVKGLTCKSGNCLSLIFTEELSITKKIRCSQSLFVSDLNSIQSILNIPKEDCTGKEVTYRKLSENRSSTTCKWHVIRDNQSRKPGQYGNNAGGKPFSCIKQTKPQKLTKVITVGKKKPLFGNELKLQKRKVPQEGKGIQKNTNYNLAGLLLTVNQKYKNMLSDAKITCYNAQVRDCRGDRKELYKMVNIIMSTTSSNPLPKWHRW